MTEHINKQGAKATVLAYADSHHVGLQSTRDNWDVSIGILAVIGIFQTAPSYNWVTIRENS